MSFLDVFCDIYSLEHNKNILNNNIKTKKKFIRDNDNVIFIPKNQKKFKLKNNELYCESCDKNTLYLYDSSVGNFCPCCFFNLFGNKLNISNKQLIHALDTNQVYTCSMHPEFISNKSGICPKCGMELILKKSDTKIYKGYTCSMHPEVVSNNPGNCPNCKMKLIEMRTVNPMSMGMMHNKMMHNNE